MDIKVFIILSILFISHCFAKNPNVFMHGPGLQPDKVVLPARYFYVQFSDNITEETVSIRTLEVSFRGLSKEQRPCHLWHQVLYTNDNSAIVRYKLYETCYDLVINVKFNSNHVSGSPLSFKGPVLPEDCDCPEKDFNQWLADYGCQETHQKIVSDLSQFTHVNFENFHEKAVKRFNNSLSSSVCHYVIKSNKIYRSCYGQHVGFKVFMDGILLSLMRKVVLPDFEIFTNLGDWPLMQKVNKNNFPMFSWCGSHDTVDIVMPTYDITDSSLENMGRVSLDMLSVQGNIEKNWDQKINMAFWRGRDASLERLKLIEISRKFPDLINASLTNFFFFRDKEDKYGPKVEHVSFFKFFDYKYQLNLDGTVAAYRFPYLLAGDSVVFKQDSKYYEHFYDDLQPWKHYIPVESNLENLVERLQWALDNDGKAKEIAEAGQMYARNNLLPRDIFCYHANLFNEWSKKLESPVTVRNGMEYIPQKSTKGCICKQSKKDEL